MQESPHHAPRNPPRSTPWGAATPGGPGHETLSRLPGLSRRLFLGAAGGAALTGLLASCAGGAGGAGDVGDTASAGGGPRTAGASPPGTPKTGGVLRAGSPPPPTAVDPVTMYDGSAIAIVQLVADYLIWLDRDFKLVPCLAEKWESEEGGRRWVFSLREGVTFSDGTPLDAKAVKATSTRCPYKGVASYRSVREGGSVPADVAWAYPDPIPAAERIRDHIAFHNEVVDIVVDGVKLERPVTLFTERLLEA